MQNCSPVLLSNCKKLEIILGRGIKEYGLNLIDIHGHTFEPYGVTIIAIISESHIAIHTYPETQHVSIDVFHCSTKPHQLYKLLDFLKLQLEAKEIKLLEVCRGNELEAKDNDYIISKANYGIEIHYHIKNNIISKRSRYQKIDIIENDIFGKMLFLDGDLQLSESDLLLYSQTLVECLKRKESVNRVAILGGGDGGVLNELLRYNFKQITLVDIDEEVVSLSKKYFYKANEHPFERPNVKIQIEDANRFLENNFEYDAIICDLTMFPEELTNKNRQEFYDKILLKIKKCLNRNGILSMQCCSAHDLKTKEMLLKIIKKYFSGVEFKSVFIPSYCEPWIFCFAIKIKINNGSNK